MKAQKEADERAQTLRLIDEGYNRKSWHGTNLRGSIRGLSAVQAAWRVGRHSIADLVVHCAYWKYTVRRRLRGEKRGSFPLKGSNWFKLAEPLTEAAWRECVALLEDQHAQLRAAIAELSPRQLEKPEPGRTVSIGMLLRGVAMHDVYHAGQIQMIKGVQKRIENNE
jgi:uncharacterized damage-inducible protein DinB